MAPSDGERCEPDLGLHRPAPIRLRRGHRPRSGLHGWPATYRGPNPTFWDFVPRWSVTEQVLLPIGGIRAHARRPRGPEIAGIPTPRGCVPPPYGRRRYRIRPPGRAEARKPGAFRQQKHRTRGPGCRTTPRRRFTLCDPRFRRTVDGGRNLFSAGWCSGYHVGLISRRPRVRVPPPRLAGSPAQVRMGSSEAVCASPRLTSRVDVVVRAVVNAGASAWSMARLRIGHQHRLVGTQCALASAFVAHAGFAPLVSRDAGSGSATSGSNVESAARGETRLATGVGRPVRRTC